MDRRSRSSSRGRRRRRHHSSRGSGSSSRRHAPRERRSSSSDESRFRSRRSHSPRSSFRSSAPCRRSRTPSSSRERRSPSPPHHAARRSPSSPLFGSSRANETAGAPITAARRGTGTVIQMLCVEDATVEGDERGTTHVLIKDDTNFEFLRTALLVEFDAPKNMPVTLKITETKGQGEKEQIYTVSSEITLEAVLHRMRSADAGSFFGALEKRDTTARRRVLRVGEASLTSKTGRVRRGAEELARRLKIASSTAWTDECDELMQAAPVAIQKFEELETNLARALGDKGYAVNPVLAQCPVCGEDVKLGNLSQPFNLFKHLKNVHKDLLAGKIYALRLEKANDARVDLDALEVTHDGQRVRCVLSGLEVTGSGVREDARRFRGHKDAAL